MDLLAKIVFLADKIGRKNLPEDLEIVKKMAYKNIDQSLKLCLEKQEKYLQQKGIKLHKDTKKLLAKLTKELKTTCFARETKSKTLSASFTPREFLQPLLTSTHKGEQYVSPPPHFLE